MTGIGKISSKSKWCIHCSLAACDSSSRGQVSLSKVSLLHPKNNVDVIFSPPVASPVVPSPWQGHRSRSHLLHSGLLHSAFGSSASSRWGRALRSLYLGKVHNSNFLGTEYNEDPKPISRSAHRLTTSQAEPDKSSSSVLFLLLPNPNSESKTAPAHLVVLSHHR